MALPPDDYFSDPNCVALEALFHEWVAQGNGRNIAWLVQKTGLPITEVGKCLVKGMWMQRIAAVAKDAARLTRQKLASDVSGLNERDVTKLTDLIEATDDKLLTAIENDQCSPAVLWKINESARRARRDALGLGQGQEGDIVGRMGKLLNDITDDPDKEPDFKLDLKKLESPPDLPEMPGQISDEEEEEEEEKKKKDEKDGEG
jgi:hypothetical protein